MYMRPGGEEIERVQAETPGVIDFIPNRPGQKKRHMAGDGITIQYGPANQIQSFSAVSVTTRTRLRACQGQASAAGNYIEQRAWRPSSSRKPGTW